MIKSPDAAVEAHPADRSCLLEIIAERVVAALGAAHSALKTLWSSALAA